LRCTPVRPCLASARPLRSAPASLAFSPSANTPPLDHHPLCPTVLTGTCRPASLVQPAGGRASPAPHHPALLRIPCAVLALACMGLACAPTHAVASHLLLSFRPSQTGVKRDSKKKRFFSSGVSHLENTTMSTARSPPVTATSLTGLNR